MTSDGDARHRPATCAWPTSPRRFGVFTAVDDLEPDRPAGLVLRPARRVRLRQDHHPADDRRAGGADQRARCCSVTGTSPGCGRTSGRSTPSSRATRSSRTSTSSRTSRSGCAGAASASVDDAGRARCWRWSQLDGLRRPPARPALRRPAAAGRAGPRADQPAAGAAARRAARRPRPEAAPADADRAEADPDRGRHHLRARHPRPGGGHDHGRHRRGDERRADRAARRPRRHVRVPGHRVRGQLPRPVQPARRRGRRAEPATTCGRRRTARRFSVPAAPAPGPTGARSSSGYARRSCTWSATADEVPAGHQHVDGVVDRRLVRRGVSTQYLVRTGWGSELSVVRRRTAARGAGSRSAARSWRTGTRGTRSCCPATPAQDDRTAALARRAGGCAVMSRRSAHDPTRGARPPAPTPARRGRRRLLPYLLLLPGAAWLLRLLRRAAGAARRGQPLRPERLAGAPGTR